MERRRRRVFPESFKREAVDRVALSGLSAGRDVTALKAFALGEVNRWAGKALNFQIGPRRLAFKAETYFLSFSLPNFHFHAATAYAVLRTRGVPIGKRDYEGRLRTRLG